MEGSNNSGIYFVLFIACFILFMNLTPANAAIQEGESTLEGVSKTYYEDGSLKHEATYKNGVLNGVGRMYYPNGQLKVEVYFKDGKRHGPRKAYHENGRPDVDENYKEGKLHGTHVLYNPKTGRPMFEANFVNGKPEGTAKLYDPQGKISYETKYVDGKPEGGSVLPAPVTSDTSTSQGGMQSSPKTDPDGFIISMKDADSISPAADTKDTKAGITKTLQIVSDDMFADKKTESEQLKVKSEDVPAGEEGESIAMDDPDTIFITRVWKDKDGFKNEEKIQITFRKKKIIQAILRDKRAKKYFGVKDFAVRRAGVTQAQLDEARKLAFASIPDIEKRYKEAGDKQYELMKRGPSISPAFGKTMEEIRLAIAAADWSFNILAVAGRSEDVEKLISLAQGETSKFRSRLIQTAGAIENRLGLLGNGVLVKAVKKTATEIEKRIAFAVARLLTTYGHSEGFPLLIGQLKSCTDTTRTAWAAEALAHSDNPEVVQAMRTLLRRFLVEKERIDKEHGSKPHKRYPSCLYQATEPAMMNLIVFGKEEDRQSITKIPMEDRHLEALVPIVREPQKIIKYLLGVSGEKGLAYKPQIVARLYPAIDTRPAKAVNDINNQCFDILANVMLNSGLLPSFAREYSYAAIPVRNDYFPRVSYCRPNTKVADMVHGKESKYLLDDLDWIPRPWALDRIAEDFVEKKFKRLPFFDYVPHENLEDVLKKAGASREATPFLNLYLAYHQTASRAFQVRHPFPRGTERRAFVLYHDKNPSGAVSGRLDVFPKWQSGSTLSFEIMVLFATVDEGGLAGLMGDTDDPTMANYVGKTGRALVGDIFLSRGIKRIELRDLGVNEKGGIVFEADVGKRDLSDLTLHLDLRLYEKTWPVDVALYASALSRKMQ